MASYFIYPLRPSVYPPICLCVLNVLQRLPRIPTFPAPISPPFYPCSPLVRPSFLCPYAVPTIPFRPHGILFCLPAVPPCLLLIPCHPPTCSCPSILEYVAIYRAFPYPSAPLSAHLPLKKLHYLKELR